MDEASPQPGGAPEADERDLAAGLLPVLLHRIHNTTQLLAALDAFARLDAAAAAERGAGDLAEAARQIDELGWLLGLLARELGAHVLRARQERAGLTPLLGAVREALRRRGRTLELPPPPLPELEPASGVLVELCCTLGRLAWLSGLAQPPGGAARLELRTLPEGHALRFHGAVDAAAADALERCARDLTGLRPQLREDGWTLLVPGPWLGQGGAWAG